MSTEVIDLCEEKQQSKLLKENTNSDKVVDTNGINEEKDKFVSPPRKKLKQESISFTKLSKEEALKSVEKTITRELRDQSKNVPTAEEPTNGEIQLSPSKENSKVDFILKSPASQASQSQKNSKPSPVLSKEEKEKLKQEREKAKLEKLKENEDRKKQKEEERKKREGERLQKLAEKEKRESEKKAEKEKKELERKEKERQKDEERKKKEEEKRKRDGQREAEKKLRDAEREKKEAERKEKDDMKRQEDEKKRLKEEQEKRKKEKAANQFKSFFTKKTQVEKKKREQTDEDIPRFVPFQLKPNMSLAPCVRQANFNKTLVDDVMDKELPDLATYLEELNLKIANNTKPGLVSRRQLRRDNDAKRKVHNCECQKEDVIAKKKMRRSVPLSTAGTEGVIVVNLVDDDVEESDDEEEEGGDTSFVGDEAKETMLVKFLRFSENTRPPYYGTWRKRTKSISGRKPFGLDKKIFNYDIDSDEEWIDEPGEDCSDNGDDDEEDDKETEDDQDGFFVPHGYLSDDEGVNDASDDDNNDDGDGNEVDDNAEPRNVSKQTADGKREKDKLKSKVDSFEVAFNKKVRPRKPVCTGIYFTNTPETCPLLKDYVKVFLYKSVFEKEEVAEILDKEKSDVCQKTPVGTTVNGTLEENGPSTPQTVPGEGMPFLIKLVHGNLTSIVKMSHAFKRFWAQYTKENGLQVRSNVSKRQVDKKIQSISTRAHNDELGKICYTVNADVLAAYELSDLKLGTGLPELTPGTPLSERAADSNSKSSLETGSNNHNGTKDIIEKGGTAMPMEID